MTTVVLVFLLYACNDGEVEVFDGCYGNRDGGGVSIVAPWVEMCRVSSPETRKDFYIRMNRSEHTDTVQNTCT